MRAVRWLVMVGLVGAATGCGSLADKYMAELTYGDPAIRAQAAARLGAMKHTDAIPNLIARLNDEDRVVRSMAVQSLQHMTGRHFGYNAGDDASARAPAIRRWQQWWERETGRSPGSSAGEVESPARSPSTAPATQRSR